MERVFAVPTPLGIVILDSQFKILDAFKIEANETIIRKVVNKFKTSTFIVEDEDLKRSLESLGAKVILEQPSEGGKFVRSNLEKILKEAFKVQDYLKEYREAALNYTLKRISEDSSRLDKELIALMNALDSINQSANELTEKLQDLNDLFFPELRKLKKNPEKYVSFLLKYPSKESLISASSSEKVEREVLEAAESSIGAPTRKESEEVIKEYAETIYKLYKLRNKIIERTTEIINGMAPNLSEVAGPVLAAKLISKAGGLLELAKMPSSTIQVIGAEKALFRAMKTGGKPPKHGLIFQHPFVHNSPRKLRGKVARALASKIALAARFDAFSGIDVSEKLKSDLKKKLKEIGVKVS